MVVFGQSGYIRSKLVLFEQKWLYLGKIWLYSGGSDILGQKGFYSGKVVVFGKK